MHNRHDSNWLTQRIIKILDNRKLSELAISDSHKKVLQKSLTGELKRKNINPGLHALAELEKEIQGESS